MGVLDWDRYVLSEEFFEVCECVLVMSEGRLAMLKRLEVLRSLSRLSPWFAIVALVYESA